MEASKWLKVQALVDEKEMRSLFDFLGNFHIYLTGTITSKGYGEVDKERFITLYGTYVTALKEERICEDPKVAQCLSSVFSRSADSLFAFPIGEDRQLVRAIKPVIQLQAHHLGYSTADNKFHSMVFGPDSISWGIQFSYPQLFQNPKTKEALAVKETEEFPNTELFHQVQRWIRNIHHSRSLSSRGTEDQCTLPDRKGLSRLD